MTKDLKDALDPDSKFHDKLLQECKELIDYSRSHMSKHYSLWDHNDEVMRGERLLDTSDQKAIKRGEPAKLTMPLTYAQSQTFIAFMCMMFSQREYFYEVEGTGVEDVGSPARDARDVLQSDVRRNRFELLKYQILRDLTRCGFCVAISMWFEKPVTRQVSTTATDVDTPFGVLPSSTTSEPVETYEDQYNNIRALSPYRFFPDVTLPLSRFQEGEFCGSEEDYRIINLKKLERAGLITNVEKIEKIDEKALDRRRTSIPSPSMEPNVSAGSAIVTQVLRWIVPADYKDDEDKTPLGDSKDPTLYVIWYANDKTILKAEPANLPHNEFPYDVGEFSADHLQTVNESLAEIIGPLQEVCSWFLNSHITSVRKNIDNKLVVDPAGVEMKDLISRSPIIRLKESMGQRGIDSWIKQLNVTDVTQKHVGDLQVLWGFMQTATGISENALGQYNGGRRSAYEARTVNSGAASRLKVIAMVLWETFFVPLGTKALKNHQDLITLEEFQARVGDDADQARYERFKAGGKTRYNFAFFDGTAPSEKGFIAQSMQELLLGLLASPESAALLSTEPFRTLVVEIAELRGIRQPSRLLPPIQQPNVIQPSPPIANPGGPAPVAPLGLS